MGRHPKASTIAEVGYFSASVPTSAWRSSAIEGVAVMAVTVPRIDLYPAGFIEIRGLAHFGGITA